jgi:hypothetical protein
VTEKATNTSLPKATIDLTPSLAKKANKTLTLRLGIAGPRALHEHELDNALLQLRQVMSTLTSVLANSDINRPVTPQHAHLEQFKLPTLILTSSLAIGADRLAMASELSACLKYKATLEYAAVLPFLLHDCEQGMYEETRSEAENRQDWLVLNKLVQEIKDQQEPRLIELAGDITSADTRDKAHFRCTQTLVANIDILIVMTKENASQAPSHHLAGTNTTLRLAQEAVLPIIQIVLDAKKPRTEIKTHPSKAGGQISKSEIFSPASVSRLLTGLGVLADGVKLKRTKLPTERE